MATPSLAWFRAASRVATPLLDDTAALIRELAVSYRIDTYDEPRAHDFVWTHARQPYDLCVYELVNTPAHAFIRPYLFHYPGVLRLRSRALDHIRPPGAARAGPTTRHRTEHLAERTFAGADMLRGPLLASRLVVVSDAQFATRLQRDHPAAAIRETPLGLGALEDFVPRLPQGPVRFGALPVTRAAVMQRAVERARHAGAEVTLVSADASEDEVLHQADVILSLEWPPSTGEPPTSALAGMARGRAVVVLETEGTARWPALDPQSWQARGPITGDEPIVISIDPRDEEHSLMLVLRRLALDRALVGRVAAAGHAWWAQHATLAHAASAWRTALEAALSLGLPARPDGWPPHLTADGSGHARRILQEMGVEVDVLK